MDTQYNNKITNVATLDKSLLDVRNLHVAYGASEVLHGVDLQVGHGEIVVLMGRNGMGKTTLMKSLIGNLPLRSGSIGLDGKDITKLPAYKRVESGLAYVPQGRMIFPAMTVTENIETGLFVRNEKYVPEDRSPATGTTSTAASMAILLIIRSSSLGGRPMRHASHTT